MKKIFLIFTVLFCISCSLIAQKTLSELPNFAKYADSNKTMEGKDIKVVFIGNSITEGWVNIHPGFFKANAYVGRGISGQTSPQLLLRFRQDVLELKPEVVVINIGTNDIAENTGKYNLQFTLDNIKSMAELAGANNIKVILSSVTPAGHYPWRKEIENVPQKIDELNKEIRNYASDRGFLYIDYNTPMRKADGSMIDSYTTDGVHVTPDGYSVMESIVKEAIDKLLN